MASLVDLHVRVNIKEKTTEVASHHVPAVSQPKRARCDRSTEGACQ
jgi:hypothetical protein